LALKQLHILDDIVQRAHAPTLLIEIVDQDNHGNSDLHCDAGDVVRQQSGTDKQQGDADPVHDAHAPK